MARSTMVVDPERGVELEVRVEGEGEDVVLVPSALRGAEDFEHLQSSLGSAGSAVSSR